MYDDVATLIKYGTSTFDEYGNESIVTEKRDVYVLPRGVYQSEFYNAAQNGLKPSITLMLSNRADYDDEKVVEYRGRMYTVIRVDWSAQRDGIALILEERTNNG